MNIKRFLGLLFAVVMLFTLIAACTPAPEPEPPAAAPPAEEPPAPAAEEPAPAAEEPAPAEPDPVTLKWAVWDIDAVAYYAPLIEGYKAVAPHVTIEMVDLGTDEFQQILQTQLIGGETYDLVKVRDVPQYINSTDAGLYMPLNSYIDSLGINLADYAGIPEIFTLDDGNLYALPFRMDWWVLFYNMDLFDEAGVDYPTNGMTFDEWVDLIKEVTHGSGTDKVYGNHFHTWRSTIQLFGVLDGVHSIIDGNYDFLAPYYEAVIDLEDGDYVIKRTDAQAGSLHHRTLWVEQQIAMVNMGSWFWADQTFIDGEWDFNWGIATYPAPTAAASGNTLGQFTQLAIPVTAQNPDEAANFMAYVCGPEGALALASVGQTPANMTEEAMAAVLATPGFPTDATSIGAMSPKSVIPELLPNPVAGEINAILDEVHNEIMGRTMSIEDALAMANERIAPLVG